MIKTHEINLTTTNFNQFNANDYIIVKDEEHKIEINDYILFKQVEIEGEETKDTGLFKMTQVRDVITDEGLKDNYVLLALTKFE
jgi:hypothetical protein|nr:MAG TPA: protein of unknown function (DUF3850) [Caudoviricetes sp.]